MGNSKEVHPMKQKKKKEKNTESEIEILSNVNKVIEDRSSHCHI